MNATTPDEIYSVEIEFIDGVKVALGADGEFFVTPASDSNSATLNDYRMAVIKALQTAQENV